jgi:hypothetical protein
VAALGSVGIGDDAPEDAGEDLPGDEDPEGEVHVRGGDAPERSQHEERDGREHEVKGERAGSWHPGESHLRLVSARERGVHRPLRLPPAERHLRTVPSRSEHFDSRLTASAALWHERAPQLPGPGAACARKEATHDAPPEHSGDEALNNKTR